MIDFTSVSTGLREIDDFEEIPYQPPDTMMASDQQGHQNMSEDDDFYINNTHHHHQQITPLTPNSPPLALKSPTIARRKLKASTVPVDVGNTAPSSTGAFSPKKKMSNKNIAASKLKQLATKRKYVKQQQQQHQQQQQQHQEQQQQQQQQQQAEQKEGMVGIEESNKVTLKTITNVNAPCLEIKNHKKISLTESFVYIFSVTCHIDDKIYIMWCR